MSELPVAPAPPAAALAPAAGPAAAPAKPLNAFQIVEQELVGYIRQREQQIANLHAIEGAIQGAQKLVGILKAEAAKAENFVEAESSKVVEFVKKEV